MPSSWSPSLRFELQFTGENINLWGDKLNAVLAHADYAVAGWLTKPLTGNAALSTANAGDDEARAAMIKFTGAGPFTVTLPSVSKSYAVWNACTAAVTLTTGAGASVSVDPNDVVQVFCDGANVKTLGFGGQSIKDYVNGVAWSYNAGALPAQAGNAGKFVRTDGTTAGWASISVADVAGLSASASAVRAGTTTTAAMTPGDTYSALAEVTLTDSATIAVDMSTFINAAVTLGGNRTLGNPTNAKPGQTGRIRLVQDGTGGRTLGYGSSWKFEGGIPPITSTSAGAVDFLDFEVVSTAFVRAKLSRAWA
jgi:hypothetical protein